MGIKFVKIGGLMSGGFIFEGVEPYGEEDDDAEYDFLCVTFDAEEVRAVLNDGDDECTDECSEYTALPAHETGAANDDCCNDVEFVHLSVGRCA